MKKIFTSIFHKPILLGIAIVFSGNSLMAQELDSLIKRTPVDTSKAMLNMDATYNRPFLTISKMPVALGGYLEANTFYASEDGVSEGLSFQARRLTMFMSASITKRIKFLSEMEF